jgi:hypothetical protein
MSRAALARCRSATFGSGEGSRRRNLCLFTVCAQDVLAGSADPGSIALQTSKDREDVVLIGREFRSAKPDHVRMAGGTLLFAPWQRWRRRLRRKLRL